MKWRSSGYLVDFFCGQAQMLLSNITLGNIDYHGSLGREPESDIFASAGWSGGPMWEYINGEPKIVGVCIGEEKDCSEKVGGCSGMKMLALIMTSLPAEKLMTELMLYVITHRNTSG